MKIHNTGRALAHALQYMSNPCRMRFSKRPCWNETSLRALQQSDQSWWSRGLRETAIVCSGQWQPRRLQGRIRTLNCGLRWRSMSKTIQLTSWSSLELSLPSTRGSKRSQETRAWGDNFALMALCNLLGRPAVVWRTAHPRQPPTVVMPVVGDIGVDAELLFLAMDERARGCEHFDPLLPRSVAAGRPSLHSPVSDPLPPSALEAPVHEHREQQRRRHCNRPSRV